MKTTKLRKGTASSIPEGMLWGVGVSVGITLAGSALLAKLLDTQAIQWEKIGYFVMIMLLIASFAGALVSSGKIKRRKLQVCLTTGAVFWLILIGLTALLFGGQFEGAGVTGALILAGAGCAGLLSIKPERGGKRSKIPVRR